jgi:hypothetical protein
MLNPNKKLNGIKLLEKIKAELGDVLEHQGISDMDLFLAAQQLIDISRTEYIEPDFRDQAQRAGYFSHPVDTAITKMQSTLWRNEVVGWHDEDDSMRFQDKLSEALTTRRRDLEVERFYA